MTYRRDVQADETIPLPVETVYSSEFDAIRINRSTATGSKFDHFGLEHFNRLYFKYPPEWKTSNVGEKIIGVRNMTIHWKDNDLRFMLYIRKYKKIIPRSNDDTVNQERINAISADDLNDAMKIFGIPINIRISCNDTWDDIKSKIMDAVNRENLYNYIYRKLKLLYSVPSEIVPRLQQLEQIKDNYYAMLAESYNLIGERIPFYLEPNDIDIIKSTRRGVTSIQFVSPQNEQRKKDFYIDFLITNLNPHGKDIHSTYKKLYEYDENGDLKGKSKDPSMLRPDDEGFGNEDSPDLNRFDWFSYFTADFLNIGILRYRNSLKYIVRFHRQFKLENVMSDLECEVAASFAYQSNHNIIGRTTETFIPIKYYKINDDNDMFWIEFYDRDELKVPVAFNSNVIFTMDVVFLQNRKLLYS